MKTNIEAYKSQPVEERLKNMKAYCIGLLVICLMLVAIIVYERRQVNACRNVAKAFVSDLAEAFDGNGGFDATKDDAKICNGWPK